MKQEAVAGMILCAMGLSLLLISPDIWWRATEKWKTRDGSGPSGKYIVLLRVLGAAFIVAGIILALSRLK